MKFCVLIPAYEEERNVGTVVGELTGKGLEVVVVDDGSRDRTGEVARKAGAVVLQHRVNQGKGRALRTGFSYALSRGYDAVITMDADGQHDPEEIPRFIEAAERNGVHLVVGMRMGETSSMPRIRYYTNIVTSFFTSLLAGRTLRDSQSGYRLIRREVLENITLKCSNYDMESEMLIKAARKGFRIKEIPIKTLYYSHLQSKIHPFRDTIRFIKLILNNWRGNRK